MPDSNIFNSEMEHLLNLSQDQVNDSEEEENVSLKDLERVKSLLDINFRKEELEGRKQDRKQRGEYANKIFVLLCAYLGIILLALFLSGLRVMNTSDTVLVALVTTATANVIGIFIFVAKYLFHTKD